MQHQRSEGVIPLSLEIKLFGTSYRELTRRLSYDSRTRAFWEAVEQRYSEANLCLTDLARESGMSKNNLNTLLKNLGLRRAKKLVNGYRLFRAIQRACAHNDSFTDIALECGFDSSASFTRTFVRFLGGPPTTLLPRGPHYERYICVSRAPKDGGRGPITPPRARAASTNS